MIIYKIFTWTNDILQHFCPFFAPFCKQKNRKPEPAVKQLEQYFRNFPFYFLKNYLVVTISPSGNTSNAGLSERLPS
ncbi:hypothetical protein ACIY19_04975, partial [Streptococcus sp. ST14]|uniref:hypothetical protein n=1 Tax=Streptococcus sp. ST14 TaxID=3378284 RepID=UPI0038D49134